MTQAKDKQSLRDATLRRVLSQMDTTNTLLKSKALKSLLNLNQTGRALDQKKQAILQRVLGSLVSAGNDKTRSFLSTAQLSLAASKTKSGPPIHSPPPRSLPSHAATRSHQPWNDSFSHNLRFKVRNLQRKAVTSNSKVHPSPRLP